MIDEADFAERAKAIRKVFKESNIPGIGIDIQIEIRRLRYQMISELKEQRSEVEKSRRSVLSNRNTYEARRTSGQA